MNEEALDSPHVPVPAIRAQLERVLESVPLRNSKRCQALLRYVVEETIEGRTETVKERIIGVKVFGRDASYDTNEDSVVRHAAGELRKRLAQYYLDHEHELRVILPQGGYVPEFHPATSQGISAEAVLTPTHGSTWRRPVYWVLAGSAMALIAGLGYWVRAEPSALHLFWTPILEDPATVVVSFGQPMRVYNFGGPRHSELDGKMVGLGSTPPEQAEVVRRTALTLGDLTPAGKRYLFLGDTLCLMKVTTLLTQEKKGYVLRGVDMTSFQDLRGSPVVLIGLNNNRWTMGLLGNLRYYFRRDANGNDELRDRQNDKQPRWSCPLVDGDERMTEDFAIVTRVVDPSTEHTVVAAAGLRHFGTLAAGDFLTNETYMREAFQSAPSGWHKKDIQVVLRTRVVVGAAGPPKIVATHFW